MKWDYVEWNFRNFTYLSRRWWWQFCRVFHDEVEVDKHTISKSEGGMGVYRMKLISSCRRMERICPLIVGGVGRKDDWKSTERRKKFIVNENFISELDRLKDSTTRWCNAIIIFFSCPIRSILSLCVLLNHKPDINVVSPALHLIRQKVKTNLTISSEHIKSRMKLKFLH